MVKELNVWHDPAEMLPLDGRTVLVVTETKKGVRNYTIAYYHEPLAQWVKQGVAKVVAWMELPEMPDND